VLRIAANGSPTVPASFSHRPQKNSRSACAGAGQNKNHSEFDLAQQRFLVSFQCVFLGLFRFSLELLENRVFPFASRCGLQYRWLRTPRGFSAVMIVCSCNVLSDDDVRAAVNASEDLPRNPKQIYGCLGCSAECGRCARTIKGIIDEALGACARACHSGCPHKRTGPESLRELPLEAAA
jgi:bacterioferritin-associated ferredoxin